MTFAKILLIEDDTDLRIELDDFLSRRRHSVWACGTLAEAERALCELAPDVVVSDINLPDGDGATFCMLHAPGQPQAKWLLMSGNQDLLQQSRNLKASPDAPPFSVLDKPVALRAIDNFVRQALAAKAEPVSAAPAVAPSSMKLAESPAV